MFISPGVLETLILVAGVGQIALAVGSVAIPRVLRWREELAPLNDLMRRLFWVYAAYILVTNLCFGLLSAFAPGWLVAPSPLAAAVSGYIALYWGARVLIQFTLFKGLRPAGRFFLFAELALTVLFGFLAFVYGAAALSVLGRLDP